MLQNIHNINEFILINLLILLLIAGIISIIIYLEKIYQLKIRLKHEIEKKKLEFIQKKEWEILISRRIEKQEDEEWIKEKNGIKERVDELWKTRNQTTPLDLNRIALLHLILSGQKESLTAENLEKEVEMVKKSYEIIKNYLKD